MQYKKQEYVGGKYVKGSEIESGIRCKLVSETTPVVSQFKNKDGSVKTQDIAKIRFENNPETLVISINRTSINALIDAFGEDSKNWQGQYLTAITEKVRVGGKAVTSIYLIPEGYQKIDDDEGFAKIVKIGGKKGERLDDEIEIKPEDIPF